MKAIRKLRRPPLILEIFCSTIFLQAKHINSLCLSKFSTMKNFVLAMFILGFSSITFSQNASPDPEEPAIKKTIDLLFEGMKMGDSSMVRQVFHSSARLMTCYTTKDGIGKVAEDSIPAFLSAVGTPHSEVWNEKITSINICRDMNLAQVWTSYEFYVDDTFSHCGVNAFQLVKENDLWLIIQLTDTRRKKGCSE